jgi:hypothetical protein
VKENKGNLEARYADQLDQTHARIEKLEGKEKEMMYSL